MFNGKKITLHGAIGLLVAAAPSIAPFLSDKQKATAAIVLSGVTSVLAALADTRKANMPSSVDNETPPADK